MKPILLLAAILSAAPITFAQDPSPTPTPDPQITTDVTDKDQNKDLPKATTQPGTLSQKPADDYVRPDPATRRKRFINSVVGPFALGRMVATAGISTWNNSPDEWGTKWEGFGRRVASNFARNMIRQSTKFSLDEALELDSNFYRSKNRSVGARIRNAVISPVTARNKNGKRVIGVPNLVGTYAAGIISYETWYPDRFGWKSGVRAGTISFGFTAAYNLFKEFVWKK